MESLSRDAAFENLMHDPGSPVRKWDVVIRLLAAWHIIKGCWLFYFENQVIWYYLKYSAYEDAKVGVWGPPWPTIALGNLVALTVVAAGVGMALGKKWGWWLAGFLYMCAVLLAIYTISMSYIRTDELRQLQIQTVLTPFVRNLVIYPFLIVYLYTRRALRSFGLTPSAGFRSKALATQIGAAIVWLIISALLMYWILTHFGRSVPYLEA
jgi:lysylphosphatidylglycerol synthetase-like protein (DUF2156 family)